MLENMSESQLRAWYKREILKKAKENGIETEPEQHTAQSLLMHDCWSMYDYGDVIKVVYFKNLPKKKDPRKDPLFSYNEKPLKEILDEEEERRKRRSENKTLRPENERFANSLSRSKSRVFELAMCNEFTHFCTFTQDEKKRDRFDLKEFRKDFAMLVRNLNRGRDENAKIKYLLIPEQHKDGAWHMHGLLMGLTTEDLREFTLAERLPERIRKQIAKGVKVYDWTRYRRAFGYFTCTEVQSGVGCAKYITKYISKDLQKTVCESGEHLFFASQGLKSRDVIIKQCFDKCPFEKWDFENDYVKVLEIQVSDKTDSKKIPPKN